MNESFDTDVGNPNENNSRRKFLKLLIIFFIVGIIIVFALGAYMLFQTRDLWLDTQPRTLSPSELEATSTATCDTFITEFPGTPCP
jgi:hypothetical protein